MGRHRRGNGGRGRARGDTTTCAAGRKLCVRGLPPSLEADAWIHALEHCDANSLIKWDNFYPGKSARAGRASRPSLGVVELRDPALAAEFTARIAKVSFDVQSSGGDESSQDTFPKSTARHQQSTNESMTIQVEYAPFPGLPLGPGKVDPLQGTLETTPDFRSFIASMDHESVDRSRTETLVDGTALRPRDIRQSAATSTSTTIPAVISFLLERGNAKKVNSKKGKRGSKNKIKTAPFSEVESSKQGKAVHDNGLKAATQSRNAATTEPSGQGQGISDGSGSKAAKRKRRNKKKIAEQKLDKLKIMSRSQPQAESTSESASFGAASYLQSLPSKSRDQSAVERKNTSESRPTRRRSRPDREIYRSRRSGDAPRNGSQGATKATQAHNDNSN